MACFLPLFYSLQSSILSKPILVGIDIEEDSDPITHIYYPFWWSSENISDYLDTINPPQYKTTSIITDDEIFETF
tara:strand:- start:293 stop:517 length:225 start_codon:yes stop_codon:yes gene_type:complete